MRTLMAVILIIAGTLSAGPSLRAAESPAELKLPWFEIRPGIVRPGEAVRITAWIENNSPKAIDAVSVRLTLPDGAALANDEPASHRVNLRAKEAKRFLWQVKARRAGNLLFQVEALSKSASARRQQRLLVVDKRDPRREHQTVSGAWLTFPPRRTL
jgi:hypothetical protein